MNSEQVQRLRFTLEIAFSITVNACVPAYYTEGNSFFEQNETKETHETYRKVISSEPIHIFSYEMILPKKSVTINL